MATSFVFVIIITLKLIFKKHYWLIKVDEQQHLVDDLAGGDGS